MRPVLYRVSVGLCGLLAGTAMTGCDLESALQTPRSEACHEAGVQCVLPEGPLGVCERAACAAGHEAPCFKCTPQH